MCSKMMRERYIEREIMIIYTVYILKKNINLRNPAKFMEKSSRCVTMMNNYNSFHPDLVLAGRSATAKQTFKKEMSAKLHCDIFTNTLC